MRPIRPRWRPTPVPGRRSWSRAEAMIRLASSLPTIIDWLGEQYPGNGSAQSQAAHAGATIPGLAGAARSGAGGVLSPGAPAGTGGPDSTVTPTAVECTTRDHGGQRYPGAPAFQLILATSGLRCASPVRPSPGVASSSFPPCDCRLPYWTRWRGVPARWSAATSCTSAATHELDSSPDVAAGSGTAPTITPPWTWPSPSEAPLLTPQSRPEPDDKRRRRSRALPGSRTAIDAGPDGARTAAILT